MANPYEGEMLQPTGFEVPNLDISIRDESGSTEQPPIDPIVEETPPASTLISFLLLVLSLPVEETPKQLLRTGIKLSSDDLSEYSCMFN